MTAREVRIVCGNFWGKKGPWTVSPPIRSISMSRCRPAEEDLPVETTRHAFAYVFARARANSAMHPVRWPYQQKRSASLTRPPLRKPRIARCCSSIEETK